MKGLICCLTILSLFFVKCGNEVEEKSPLFYQISKADSLKYMKQILDEISNNENERQRLIDYWYNSSPPPCDTKPSLQIVLQKGHQPKMNFEFRTEGISSIIYEYYMYNRNLTEKKKYEFQMDVSYEGFDFPFYDHLQKEEIIKKKGWAIEELDAIKRAEGADSVLIEHYASIVKEWQLLEKALIVIGDEEIIQMWDGAHICLEFDEEFDERENVLNQIALGYYQIRNYECMRYFGETYLSLFERFKRTERAADFDKLNALNVLHPISHLFKDELDRKGITIEETIEVSAP